MICLDSCCIIDILKGVPEVKNILEKQKDKFCTTEVAIFEVMKGLQLYYFKNKRKQDIDSFYDFISTIDIIPTTSLFAVEAAEIYANLKIKGTTIDDLDLLTIGMMRRVGCEKIITRNVKHFSGIKGITPIPY